MRRDPDRLLDYEIRRRPEWAALSDRLADTSLEELNAMSFPLKWIRDAFIARRARIIAQNHAVEAIENGQLVDGSQNDPIGTVLVWMGQDEYFARIDRDGSIALRHGRPLLLLDHGGIFIDNLFSQLVDPIIHQRSKVEQRLNLSGYKQLCSDIRNRLAPAGCQQIEVGSNRSTATSHLASLGVRFR